MTASNGPAKVEGSSREREIVAAKVIVTCDADRSGAALHFDAWVSNFGIQEWMRHSKETDAVFPHDYFFRDGRLHCGETPGHGVGCDEKLAAKYPYSPKQLTIARLEDGSMWDW